MSYHEQQFAFLLGIYGVFQLIHISDLSSLGSISMTNLNTFISELTEMEGEDRRIYRTRFVDFFCRYGVEQY